MLIVPTLQRGYAVVTLQRPCADHHRKAGSRRHTPSFARNPMPPASPTETCPSGGGPSIARLRLRLAQTGMHRKHPVALDQTGRGSTQGCIHTLERGNDQARDQSFCGPFPILSRAWPAPETSIVVGRSGPRPRCQGGHARWWPPLTQDGAGAQGAAFCPRFVTITGTTFSWVQARTNPKQPFVSTCIFISSNPRRSARRIECPP